MHDAKGRPVQVGDVVFVPCRVTETYSTDEFCNAQLKTVATMYPGNTHSVFTVNTRQVFRANTEDDNSSWSETKHDDGSVSIGD